MRAQPNFDEFYSKHFGITVNYYVKALEGLTLSHPEKQRLTQQIDRLMASLPLSDDSTDKKLAEDFQDFFCKAENASYSIAIVFQYKDKNDKKKILALAADDAIAHDVSAGAGSAGWGIFEVKTSKINDITLGSQSNPQQRITIPVGYTEPQDFLDESDDEGCCKGWAGSKKRSTVGKVIAGTTGAVGVTAITFGILAACNVAFIAKAAAAIAIVGFLAANWLWVIGVGAVLAVGAAVYFGAFNCCMPRDKDEPFEIEYESGSFESTF